jgi:hypothetical protein
VAYHQDYKRDRQQHEQRVHQHSEIPQQNEQKIPNCKYLPRQLASFLLLPEHSTVSSGLLAAQMLSAAVALAQR